MFQGLASLLGLNRSTKVPAVSYRTHLARLIAKQDVRGILEYLKSATSRFGKDLVEWDDYIPLLTKKFFLDWTREYSSNKELADLGNALESFTKSGRFQYRSYEFPKIDGVLKAHLQASADASMEKVRKDYLHSVRLCVYFLTSGGLASPQESVQKFNELAKRAPNCTDGELDTLLLLAYNPLNRIIAVFEKVDNSFEIVSTLLKGFSGPDRYYAKEQIEAKTEVLRNRDLRSMLEYYVAFLGEVDH